VVVVAAVVVMVVVQRGSSLHFSLSSKQRWRRFERLGGTITWAAAAAVAALLGTATSSRTLRILSQARRHRHSPEHHDEIYGIRRHY
jgi:uncharacterized membrane protein affecting hemolysin expression